MSAKSFIALALVLTAALSPGPGWARSLASIKESGAIALCANPNALPFASRKGDLHGFQVDLAEALAQRLGVSLTRNWIVSRADLHRTDCDIVMDAIADREAQGETGLRLSKPYRRSGVALAVRGDQKIMASVQDLGQGAKVGVVVGSIAAMKLTQGGFHTIPDLFEDELLGMLGKGEVDAAAVTPTAIGYFNLTHPDHQVRTVYAFDGEPELSWNVAVGLRRPDPALTDAVNDAIDKLLVDGTVERIYARYGVELRAPK